MSVQRTKMRLGRCEFGVIQRQPLESDLAEIHLHARVAAPSFGIDDYARAELGMQNVLSYLPW